MKKIATYSLLSFFALFFVGIALRETPFAKAEDGLIVNRPFTEVTGTAEMKIPPDIAEFTLTASGEGKDSAEASAKSTKIANALIAAYKKAGVAEKDLHTEQFQIYPQYQYDEPKKRNILTSFTARQTLRLVIRDLKKAGDMVDIAAKNGVSEAGNLQFLLENDQKYRAEILKNAVADAKEKATALANAAGAELGEPLEIAEAGANFTPRPVMYAKAAMLEASADSAPQITPGDSVIRADVRVKWALK